MPPTMTWSISFVLMQSHTGHTCLHNRQPNHGCHHQCAVLFRTRQLLFQKPCCVFSGDSANIYNLRLSHLEHLWRLQRQPHGRHRGPPRHYCGSLSRQRQWRGRRAWRWWWIFTRHSRRLLHWHSMDHKLCCSPHLRECWCLGHWCWGHYWWPWRWCCEHHCRELGSVCPD